MDFEPYWGGKFQFMIYSIRNEMGVLFMLDKARTSPYGLAVWVCISSALHIVFFKSHVNNDYQVIQRFGIVILALLFSMPMHELIHFIFLKIFSKGKVIIEFAKDPVGLPCLRTTYYSKITKWQNIVSLLAPFVFLTLLFDVAFVFCPKVELVFFVVSMGNSAGCYCDIIDALKALQNGH